MVLGMGFKPMSVESGGHIKAAEPHRKQGQRSVGNCHTWGCSTKFIPSVLLGTSQDCMSRFPTLTLTLNPHINGSLPAGMVQKTHCQTKPFSKEHSSEIRLTSGIFFLFFFLLYKDLALRVTAYFPMPRCISFTYRGYTGVTGRTYPFKNCSN